MFRELETLILNEKNIQAMMNLEKFIECEISGGLT